MDSNQFNSGFWLSLVGIFLSFLTGLSIYFLKSKCKKCAICFGLIQVERDVQAENDEEKMEIEHNIPYIPTNTIK